MNKVLPKSATIALAVAASASATIVALMPGRLGHARAAEARSREVMIPLRAQQTDIIDAYDILHRLGLRVTLSQQTTITSLIEPVAKLTPPPGTRVPGGSTVEMTPEHAPIGSPAVLKSHPHYRVPSFIGSPLTTAVEWATKHEMFWAIPALPPQQGIHAARLFDAYRVVAQQPKPGSMIVQGVMVGRGFKPTPLTLTVTPA